MPSQDGPGGAPEVDLGDARHLSMDSDHNPYPRGTVAAVDTADPDLAVRVALAELAALRSGVRALADTMVRTGRVPENEVQGMLRQLGVPPLERRLYRLEVPVSGVAYIDVMASDATEAKLLAGSIVDRGTRSMISTMLPGGARVGKLGRSDEAVIVKGKLSTGEEVTIP